MKNNGNNISDDKLNLPDGFTCPLPISDYETIQLAHGAGGKMMSDLIESIFIQSFSNKLLNQLDDQARFEISDKKLVFTTDTFVVSPIFFPGGNIGDLAINGTVNDICMSGAIPLYLSAGFVLEEGLQIKDLHKIVVSMKTASNKAGVQIVTGDTKVVNKGSCDKIFINTSGIGVVEKDLDISASNLQSGDLIILSGNIAEHGMAIMTSREGLSFETQIKSDTASLETLVQLMLKCTKQIHAMRDPTRGGVAATLNEFAKQSKVGIKIFAEKIPIREEVKGACEILGIDPLFVANEGKLIAVVIKTEAKKIVEKMKTHPLGQDAVIIGEVLSDHPGMVVKKTILGVEHIVDLPVGELLPRIC